MCYSWSQAIDMIDRQQRPLLGDGMFRYYLDESDFERKKSVCAEALALVADDECVDLANETRVVSSYVNLAHTIYSIAELVATAEVGVPEMQVKLSEMIEALELAGEENLASIRTWRSGLGPEPWHYRVLDALSATDNTVAEIARIVRERHLH